ncbi:hypothetical protein [Burkholderia cepacia]|uniref:hypothetical protein n=1 Tax=Burkholderia cepacia TaxID=292 RepID=UPI00298F858B|nr:hypothetical protein [Burkholderia cepacia]MDW9244786.1 hypothetical protein [Burkholderia cepacia]
MMIGLPTHATQKTDEYRKDSTLGTSAGFSTRFITTSEVEMREQRDREARSAYERAYLITTVFCFSLGALILMVVIAGLIADDDFITAILSFFGV